MASEELAAAAAAAARRGAAVHLRTAEPPGAVFFPARAHIRYLPCAPLLPACPPACTPACQPRLASMRVSAALLLALVALPAAALAAAEKTKIGLLNLAPLASRGPDGKPTGE